MDDQKQAEQSLMMVPSCLNRHPEKDAAGAAIFWKPKSSQNISPYRD
jgi:hypothetical protein